MSTVKPIDDDDNAYGALSPLNVVLECSLINSGGILYMYTFELSC